jgi:CDP-diacylglycerol--glycerol-3-phosphate 3-phosphatidyltransferase
VHAAALRAAVCTKNGQGRRYRGRVLDGRWRTEIERGLKPIGANLRKLGLTADLLTAIGLVMAGAASVAIANGALRAGVLLLLLTALPDALDGAVAKASGTAGPRGAFFDSVADRVSDALLLGGVGWYLASEDGGHAAMLPFAVLAASLVISYQRAKAESLGFQARGGLMERAERTLALGFGLLFDAVLVPVLWVMLVLTLVTAVRRFAKVWRQASVPPPEPMLQRWRGRRLSRPTERVWRTRTRRARR